MLRLCSIGARGLWAEMMCIMHDAEDYGSLLVNGRRIDKKQLAALAGVSEKECTALMLELEGNGVFSRDDDGTIYSRRMRRDFEKATKDKENGKGGGNPRLKGGVNPPDNGGDKAQKPEARSQSQKEETSLREVSAPAKRGTRLPEEWSPSIEDWNEAVTKLGQQGAKLELSKFRDHWKAAPGQRGVKLDWDATFRNWIRNARGQPNGSRNSDSRKTGHDAVYAVLARKAREIVGDGEVAGAADTGEFSFGDGANRSGTSRSQGAIGRDPEGHDGGKSGSGGVLEGEVIAPGETHAGLSGDWRHH